MASRELRPTFQEFSIIVVGIPSALRYGTIRPTIRLRSGRGKMLRRAQPTSRCLVRGIMPRVALRLVCVKKEERKCCSGVSVTLGFCGRGFRQEGETRRSESAGQSDVQRETLQRLSCKLVGGPTGPRVPGSMPRHSTSRCLVCGIMPRVAPRLVCTSNVKHFAAPSLPPPPPLALISCP